MGVISTLFTPAEQHWLRQNCITHPPLGISPAALCAEGLYIFGAGYVGQELASCLEGEFAARNLEGPGILGFIDNNPAQCGQHVAGKPIYALADAPKSGPRILACSGYAGEMARQCQENGYDQVIFPADIDMFFVTSTGMTEYWEEVDGNSRYLELHDLLADDASREILKNLLCFKLTLRREVLADYTHDDMYCPAGLEHRFDYAAFVDCGAYDGDTFRWWQGHCPAGRAYYGFEPAEEPFARLAASVAAADNPSFRVYRCGLSDAARFADFCNTGSQAGTTQVAHAQHTTRVELRRFDDVYQGDGITFFKADVEAAEPEVLRGAERCLHAETPDMAICVYHRKEHLWEIPQQIRQIDARYKVYLRHHDKTYGSSCVIYVFGVCSFHEVSYESTRIQDIHGKGEASE